MMIKQKGKKIIHIINNKKNIHNIHIIFIVVTTLLVIVFCTKYNPTLYFSFRQENQSI